MKITSFNKYISSESIEKIIQLLPKEYNNLNIKIIILNNKWQFIPYVFHRESISTFKKIFFNHDTYLLGTSYTDINYIFICSWQFKIKDDEYKELNILHCIAVLIHEIRHQYQNKYIRREKDNKSNYKDRWQEKDADKFTSVFMRNNLNKICEIIVK